MKLKHTAFPIVFFVLLSCYFVSCQQSKSKESTSEGTKEKAVYVRDEMSIQHGRELFNQYCANCHNFQGNGIGPDLSGVTSKADKAWLVSFIQNAPKAIDSGDEQAVQLYKKYNLYMPAFTMLDKEQIEHILGFIHGFSQGEKKSRKNRPGELIDPIPGKIPASGLTLVLKKFITVPPSDKNPPLARINNMVAIQGDKGERLFINDLRGKLYEIEDGTASVYIDLAAELPDFIDHPGLGTGFSSVAFHPAFEKNGLFYTDHTEPKHTAPADFAIPDSIRTTLQWVLDEWKATDPKAKVFSGTHRELMRADMYSGIHGFQEIAFDPLAKPGQADHGMLYIGVGDGGASLDGYPFLCDNIDKIWGKVLRIDPTGHNSANGKYGIPKDNPFVNDPKALGIVWASGFRNPHRMSWDRKGSGKMFITNIGQHSVEEVNLGIAGANYGWPKREGTFLYDVDANPEVVYPLPANDAGYTYPVVQFDHDEGNAVCGGYVYAGTAVPLLKGKYIFGDIARGKLFYAEADAMVQGQQAPVFSLEVECDGKATDMQALAHNKRADLRIGMDGAGEMYIFTKTDGVVYKVIGCNKTGEAL